MSYSQVKILLLVLSIIFGSFYSRSLSGQTSNKFDFERIEDNSFLIEEAYNQEPGVIQHISSLQLMKGNDWIYTFTEEWPVPGQKHQLSTTIPLLNTQEFGFGDIALNYRFQVFLYDRTAFAPRISLLLPSGNYKNGEGAGVPGFQLNLPFSFIVSRMIVTHYNLGATLTPRLKNPDGSRSDETALNYGLSVILLLNKNFNFMLEFAGSSTTLKSPNNQRVNSGTLLLNPGLRYAINFKSGLQIVPGFAVPIGFGPSAGEIDLFAYLSFEHPLWKSK